MRNLLGRLHTRDDAELGRIMTFWRVSRTGGTRHMAVGTLYRTMIDIRTIRAAWGWLTPEQQEVFLEIGAEAAAHFNELMAEDHARSMEQAEAEGAVRVAVERDVWQAAIEPFWEQFAPRVGGIERIRAIAETE